MRDGEGRQIPEWLVDSMFDRRILFLSGVLDDRKAGELAIAMMSLGTSDEPITLHIDSPGGALDAALTVMDAIDTSSVPVHAMCSGRVEGSAIGVLAACARRRATGNAHFRLHVARDPFSGRASDAEEWLQRLRHRLERFVSRLSQATGQDEERVRADLEAGRHLDAEEALRYGLIDEVLGRPDAEVIPLKDRP